MWHLHSFEDRVLALVLFLGVASYIEWGFRGAKSVRWRASLVILGLGAVGAVVGPAIDMATSSISLTYFAIGKDLGWEDGLRWRTFRLGVEAGTFAGVVIGCTFAYFNYRSRLPSLSPGQVLRHAMRPFCFALPCGVLFGAVGAFLPVDSVLGAFGPAIAEEARRGFAVVWCTHIGIYFGAFCGTVAAAVSITRSRRQLSCADS